MGEGAVRSAERVSRSPRWLVIGRAAAARDRRVGLPDLASRAAGAVVYRLEPLQDEDQIAALIGHARARGLELDRAAAEYLQHRVARDMSGLTEWLERLDRASLVAQRRLTIPFIRELLAVEPQADHEQTLTAMDGRNGAIAGANCA